MQIFVDADACPVVGIVETIAEKYNISTTLLCDTNHMKGPRKRTEDDDVRFAQSFEKLILMAKSKEGAQSGTIKEKDSYKDI